MYYYRSYYTYYSICLIDTMGMGMGMGMGRDMDMDMGMDIIDIVVDI